jgi:hypothetical protein
MMSLIDYAEDATVRIPFTTHAAEGGLVAPSEAFDAGDFRIYKDGGETQKATDNGLTTLSPFDSITGSHQLTIDTSVDTGDVGFWESGSVYNVFLYPLGKTVDGQTVGKWVGAFRLGFFDQLKQKANQIGTANGVVSSPASNGSNGPELNLRMRDDFTDENGQPIEITLPSGWPDITGIAVTDIYLGFGPEFGSSELQVNATEIVQSGPAVDQIVKFEPREADTTDLEPDNSWKATCLVVYSSSHRRSFNLDLEVERSWVE